MNLLIAVLRRREIHLPLVLLFAFLVRLYYFFLTRDQPLWWDEAEYALKAKSMILGTPDTGFWDARPILFPVLLAGFGFLGLGEVWIRFFLLLVSLGAVLLVYLLGAKMFSHKVGLCAAFFFSLESIHLFYSMRIMTDVLHVALGLLAFYLFLSRRRWHVRMVLPVVAMGTLVRFPTFLFFVVLVTYLGLVEGRSFLRNRDYWISAALALLVALPYLVWSQLAFGNPLYAIWQAGTFFASGVTAGSGFVLLKQYMASLAVDFPPLLLALFVAEAIFFYDLLFGFDAVIQGKDKTLRYRFLLLVWIVVTLAYYSFAVKDYTERYIFMAYPAICLVIALAVVRVQRFVTQDQEHQKTLPVVLLLAVLGIGGFQLWRSSHTAIEARLTSYDPVRQAGLWIRENSQPGARVLTMSVPQNTFYSERESYVIPGDEAEFAATLATLKPRYVVLSVLEKHPDWVQGVDPRRYGLRPLRSIPEENPVLVIYGVGT